MNFFIETAWFADIVRVCSVNTISRIIVLFYVDYPFTISYLNNVICRV